MGQPALGEVGPAARIVRLHPKRRSSMAELDEAESRARAQMRDLIKKHTEPRTADDRRADEPESSTSDDQPGHE